MNLRYPAKSNGTIIRGRDARESFFLHLRPKTANAPFLNIKCTWLLGFFSVFFLVFECITGAVLMLYYAPTPAEAYESIIRLGTEVPFGWLIRDLHRLGGECMLIAVTLHMLRVLCAGAYHGAKRFTWLTGILLWLCTVILAFSGYLLPWDQIAYWAVTIGTSLAETIPGIGHRLTWLLRGGDSFGGDGLLRFYLLHIVITPVLVGILLAVHYYRVVRLHGTSDLSGAVEPRSLSHHNRTTGSRLAFFPTIPLFELCLSLFTLTVLLIAAIFFYDAPLQLHADSRHTPTDIRAPWFFLWLQGALKLGDSFTMGVCFPLLLLLLPAIFPYLDRGRRKSLQERPLFICILCAAATAIIALTFLGLPRYGVHLNPATHVFNTFAPEEGRSRFHAIGFSNLPQNLYVTSRQPPDDFPVALRELLTDFTAAVEALAENDTYLEPQGIVIIEDWQVDLKRITLRIHWQDNSEQHQPMSDERSVYLHRTGELRSALKAGKL